MGAASAFQKVLLRQCLNQFVQLAQRFRDGLRPILQRGMDGDRFDQCRDLIEVGDLGFVQDALFQTLAGIAVDGESCGLVEELGDGVHSREFSKFDCGKMTPAK